MSFLARWFYRHAQKKTRPTVRPRRLELETLEERTLLSSGFRPIDEIGNNSSNQTWGTAGTDLLRFSPADYANGINSPSLAQDASARVISDILNNQADPNNPSQDIATIDQNSVSDFGYVWGQFIDHDMDLTPTNPNDLLTILADPNDPSQMGNQTFARSVSDPNTGTTTARQQINAVTSYLDLSQVYGSTDAMAQALRTFSGGRLKTSPGNMLPYDNLDYFTPAQLATINMANDSGAVPTSNLFVTGDVRGNENVELTALQTLFVRNHNLIASELQKTHPNWTDEQLYQEARKINIAEYQYITYTQYLPDLLGPNALPSYNGYNPKVDVAIATEFSTVAFRFGHSMLSGNIERQNNNGQDITGDPTGDASLSLATDFFDPNVLNPNGDVDPLTGHISTDIDAILKGDADGNANATDLMAINEIRDLLFANGGLTDNGQDLMARDIERAREDGIGSYNDLRAALGLSRVTSFSQITRNATVQKELQQAYGNVDNIDPFEGGLAEDHVAGSDMGPLFTRILVNQFTRLRNGDRYFYLNEQWTSDELSLFWQGNTLAKMIETNTQVTNLQKDVFLFKGAISGTVFFDANANGQKDSGEFGIPGLTVELLNGDGNVVATTQTNSNGQFLFTQLSRPAANLENGSGLSATGYYSVELVLPSGLNQTTSNPAPMLISRGGLLISGVNFGVAKSWQSAVSPNLQTSGQASIWETDLGLNTSYLDAWLAVRGSWMSPGPSDHKQG